MIPRLPWWCRLTSDAAIGVALLAVILLALGAVALAVPADDGRPFHAARQP